MTSLRLLNSASGLRRDDEPMLVRRNDEPKASAILGSGHDMSSRPKTPTKNPQNHKQPHLFA